ncbi:MULTISPECIES: hypothetical protein [unclassified Pseudomonas]|uniref:DUF7168 domain-containing protein n=1 Tax=Pseudomonas sp. Hg7Tf TaxID=3236988 RepID=A0AB39I0D3_9PSED|nr:MULTISPECIES: hypothetical protein [unclassified Pseudomonas]MDH2558439.1 hypothetical protein [Pseudomonas sp. Hg5Tf]
MREYRLTEMDVHLCDVGEVESEKARVKRRPTWDQHLGSIVGEAFGVRSFSRRSWCKSTSRVMDRELFVGVSPAPQIAMYAYEALLTKLTQARREYVSQVRAGKQRSSYSPETAGDHFALAWVSAVHDKIHELAPRGEEDLAIGQHSNGRELVAVEAKDKALIEQYLSGREIGKARKARKVELDLDALDRIMRRTSQHLSPFFIFNEHGKRMSWPMLRNRWADAREAARVKAEVEKKPDLANRIAQFQFRDIRPKAASEINDLSDASVLLGHSKEGITERVYRRVGAIAKPSK